MPLLLQVALVTALWCALHSLFVTHGWRDLVRRRWPRFAPAQRLVYVLASTLSLAVWYLWIRSLPERLLWDWPGAWQILRGSGVALGVLFLGLGARAHDGRAFLGWRQWRERGRPDSAPATRLRTDGILGLVRHPWYTATLLLIVFSLPWTDVNLIWRAVFFVYTVLGTHLEERKLIKELGVSYLAYCKQVPRFLPRWSSRNRD